MEFSTIAIVAWAPSAKQCQAATPKPWMTMCRTVWLHSIMIIHLLVADFWQEPPPQEEAGSKQPSSKLSFCNVPFLLQVDADPAPPGRPAKAGPPHVVACNSVSMHAPYQCIVNCFFQVLNQHTMLFSIVSGFSQVLNQHPVLFFYHTCCHLFFWQVYFPKRGARPKAESRAHPYAQPDDEVGTLYIYNMCIFPHM